MTPNSSTATDSRPGTTAKRAPFRADIQGLRAIAVALVVVYHTGVLGLAGGYVGVDVFFVISGFLITNHLLAQLSTTGRINFGQFYARRVRRILPASFAVLLLSLGASLLLLPPAQRPNVLSDTIWTALYVPNVAFAVDGTNYLAETAPSPFQHYWSLGVEEQFYLFWPLVLVLIWLVARRSGRAVTIVVGGLVALSLFACVVLTLKSQPWAFFGLPTRAWELGIGALVAVVGSGVVAKIPEPARAVLGWAGLGAVIASAIFFDSSTIFPGTAALLPVIGTAAVIFAGQRSARYSPEKILSLRPMVFIGAISYSLYLVHWPLLVIPAAVGGSAEPLSPWASVSLALLGIPIAWLLYEFVENPVRRAHWLSRLKARWTILMAAGASAATVMLAVVVLVSIGAAPLDAGKPAAAVSQLAPGPGFTSYVPSNLNPGLASVSDDIPAIYDDGCHLSAPDANVQECAFGDVRSDTVVALFGDSHAAQWFPALEQVATTNGIRLETYTKSSCPSADVPIYVDTILYQECAEWRTAVIRKLRAEQPEVVVLSNMTNQPGQPAGGITPASWEAGLTDVVDSLPESQILMIADTPHLPGTPSICLSANLDNTEACAQPREDVIELSWALSEAQAARATGATLLDLNDYLCTTDTCGMIIGSTLVYRDAHHLTTTLVEQLAPKIEDALRGLLPGLAETTG